MQPGNQAMTVGLSKEIRIGKHAKQHGNISSLNYPNIQQRQQIYQQPATYFLSTEAKD
ncbi:uncharacterized protein ACLA_061200 [Aspergillus clavatus NRRL 1]|uniref:Uncharacterized protein n=1 Tax=Aspergillus clavatus (strain ATCC 1007 / CBS 513.65 / DSM 816 / NCTC 3887 / NRRL 1 / QM 1276 / 107) TaxID=344612 RepID=A1CCA2_ASPCL|nr:uncharacterized protein ACLA_061200 [Aspergillus clavatus NRRL 1]EAW12159.1 hypothetical protein ACLA_061200 [Aspergillus clavatus NRRL 1]